MAFSPIDASIGVGKAMNLALWEAVRDSLNYLNGSISIFAASDIPNGSFEIDSDSDGIPDNWTQYLYPGGAGAIDATDSAHGTNCVTCIHPGGAGNGGCYWESDYYPVNQLKQYSVSGIIKASAAGMKIKVQVRYFDASKVELGAGSPADLYSSTSNPTAHTRTTWQFTAPNTTRFIKLRLVGGYTDTNVPGTTRFDGFSIQQSMQDNDIQDTTITSDKLAIAATAVNLSLPVAGSTVVVPRGMYILATSTGTCKIQTNSGGWVDGENPATAGKVVGSDGTNVRFANTSGVANTVYLWKI